MPQSDPHRSFRHHDVHNNRHHNHLVQELDDPRLVDELQLRNLHSFLQHERLEHVGERRHPLPPFSAVSSSSSLNLRKRRRVWPNAAKPPCQQCVSFSCFAMRLRTSTNYSAISGTGASRDGTSGALSSICSTMCRWVRSCGLTPARRSGRTAALFIDRQIEELQLGRRGLLSPWRVVLVLVPLLPDPDRLLSPKG